MVVDQDAACRSVGSDGVAEYLQARNGVEIETEDGVGLPDGPRGRTLGVVLEDDDPLDARHPVEKIGIFIGHDARYLVPHAAQHLGPGQRRTHGVAVGIGMGDDHEPLPGLRQQLPQTSDMLGGKCHRLSSGSSNLVNPAATSVLNHAKHFLMSEACTRSRSNSGIASAKAARSFSGLSLWLMASLPPVWA